MSSKGKLDDFADLLGYTFTDQSLLRRALTHGSAASPSIGDNQRLEFLGDRVLGLVIVETLLEADPGAPEGLLAPRFNALVRKETCAEVARAIDLGGVLTLGRSEMLSGGRRKDALLADAMEAVIAAVYCDGGLEPAREVIVRLWGMRIETVEEDARDPKTALQEWAQARKQNPPVYTLIGRSGPDHQPEFEMQVTTEAGQCAKAKGLSKRQAEQEAARLLLARLDGASQK